MLTQGRPKKKPTGARYVAYRGKRKYESCKQPTLTKIGALKPKKISGIGNTKKTKLLVAEFANVLDQKTKKFTKAKIKNVVENPANRHFIRRNIITKGSVIETEAGKARVTSRPGQDGIIDAVLV
ncbi:30S ribosomal protein S8e [Candidatus Woesearchaeota archaeon]|nr:30S ribosomal protein S8e [Candidatus Woesearchaeota archaeon]